MNFDVKIDKVEIIAEIVCQLRNTLDCDHLYFGDLRIKRIYLAKVYGDANFFNENAMNEIIEKYDALRMTEEGAKVGSYLTQWFNAFEETMWEFCIKNIFYPAHIFTLHGVISPTHNRFNLTQKGKFFVNLIDSPSTIVMACNHYGIDI
jgi:hypothetical protein